MPTIVVGHVTKDGGLAGPKTLEHLVDVVLQLEGDGGPYRILRAHKNRFGSTQEIGVFEMRGAGMAEVANPSAHLLAERPVGAPGSVVVASADGARPLLVEIQALVAPASAGIGRRTAAGVDGNRVSLLLAVLAQRASCDVLDRDVFVNVAGGLRLTEPAIDLGIACAIASSARGRAIDAAHRVFGEVGLAGEIRAVHAVRAAARRGGAARVQARDGAGAEPRGGVARRGARARARRGRSAVDGARRAVAAPRRVGRGRASERQDEARLDRVRRRRVADVRCAGVRVGAVAEAGAADASSAGWLSAPNGNSTPYEMPANRPRPV